MLGVDGLIAIPFPLHKPDTEAVERLREHSLAAIGNGSVGHLLLRIDPSGEAALGSLSLVLAEGLLVLPALDDSLGPRWLHLPCEPLRKVSMQSVLQKLQTLGIVL
jgi:hypothetical protein